VKAVLMGGRLKELEQSLDETLEARKRAQEGNRCTTVSTLKRRGSKQAQFHKIPIGCGNGLVLRMIFLHSWLTTVLIGWGLKELEQSLDETLEARKRAQEGNRCMTVSTLKRRGSKQAQFHKIPIGCGNGSDLRMILLHNWLTRS